MPFIVLPTPLVERAGGRRRLTVDGTTVGECLQFAQTEVPELDGWFLDDQGRIREHVNVFVGDAKAALDRPLSNDEEVFVIQAISGGANQDGELLVGTKKGLFVLRGPRGAAMDVNARLFGGQECEYAMRDSRTGRYFASVTHGQFGPHLYYTDDLHDPHHPHTEWRQAKGPAFPEGPEGKDASVKRIWVIEPGVEDGVLWAGVAPAALFRSEDNGETWQLNQPLWQDPSRPDWEGGLGGLCLHSICPWPGDPKRLTLAISSVGVWQTEDGGGSWTRFSSGLVPRYLPKEAHAETIQHCVHKLEQSPTEPDTFYMQFHGGVYRSDDAGHTWNDIATDAGLPADFGFPIVADPRNAERAWVIPLAADVDRVTPEGKVRVYETADRGASWRPLTNGLPQEDAYLTVLRQAFCHDGADPLGLYFGAESGTVYGSADAGQTWSSVAENLPPVNSVRASR